MQPTPGSRLGPYEILESIGAGGMGELFRARDTRLDRLVAVKVLAAHLSNRPDLRARLEREARAISSLNHPNICALYDVGSEAGVDYLVMEYLEGETLAARLAAGPLPIETALRYCRQIAAALEAAHDRGVLHRDLKTSNVQVTPDGTVKLLDFGLAKTETAHPAAGTSRAPTAVLDATRAGTLLGSPPYMSPEQVRGGEIDRRSDIWSFGCILFEILSGRRPFGGQTTADILAAILEREPDWTALPSTVPNSIPALVRRCLEKDPARRHRQIAEAGREIDAAIAVLETDGAAGRRAGRHSWIGYAAVALLAIGMWYLMRTGGREPAAPLPSLTQFTFAKGIEESPAWSPGGDRLAYAAGEGIRKIFLHDLSDPSPQRLTRGEFDEIHPAWSPGRPFLLFVRGREPGEKLEPGDLFGVYVGGDVWIRDLESGRENRLIEDAYHPAWSPDGRRIAVDASWVGARRIWIVDEQGRNPKQVTFDSSEAVSHLRPRWSPDGTKLVFQNMERTKFDLRVVDVNTGATVAVTDDIPRDLNPVWSPDGKFIFFSSYRSGGFNIWRIPVHPDGSPRGRPQQMTTGGGHDVELAIAPGGDRLAFSNLKQNADLVRLPLSPATGAPTGPPREVVATTREDSRGAWSADGRRIAFNSDRAGSMNIWTHDLESGETRPVTEGPGGDFQPNWSPGGDRIAFFSSRSGNPDIWTVDLASGELRNLTDRPAMDANPFFSPDGGRIAFHSDEGGRMEVWVMEADGAGARSLTRIGADGHALRWSDDGRFLFFLSPHGPRPGAYRVPADGGEPQPLPEVRGGAHMSFSPDRRHILDVVGHKTLWISPLLGGEPRTIFQFDDPGVRIDYPIWSPDGNWALFDRFLARDGDIWLMSGFTDGPPDG